MRQTGFSFIEILISCLLTCLAVICLSTLHIKSTQLLDEHHVESNAKAEANNVSELLLAEPTAEQEVKRIVLGLLK